MKYAHNIEMRVFSKEGEDDEEKIIGKVHELFPFDFEKEIEGLTNQKGVDIVVEATGAFESYEKVAVHKTAGAKRVVLTAPAKDEDNPDGRTVLMGVND